MSLAKKCDRCGDLYADDKPTKSDNDTFNSVGMAMRRLDNTGYQTVRLFDLCPRCQRLFVNWINQKEN